METPALFLVGCIATCAALYGVLFLLSVVIPYFVFYFLTWGILTCLVGIGLRLVGRKKGGGLDYRRAVIGISVLVIVTYFLVGVPESHRIIAIAKDKNSETVLQWPWAFEAFNSFNQSWRKFCSFFLGHEIYHNVLFDRNEISVIAWSSLLMGAPFCFWVLSGRDIETEEQKGRSKIKTLITTKNNEWQDEELKWKEEQSKLQARCDQIHQAYEFQKKEKEKLEVKLQYVMPQGLTTKALDPAKKKLGVLDSDLL